MLNTYQEEKKKYKNRISSLRQKHKLFITFLNDTNIIYFKPYL